MKVKVYAKLNLALNVYPKQGAFHPIESVATSVDVYDVVEVKARRDTKVRVKGFLPNEQNVAYKTALAFCQEFATKGVDISIAKGIPVGAGMGGSSADAVAVIYCMCHLFGVDINSPQIAKLSSSLGSDLTFMLKGGLGLMQGKGDDVTLGQTDTLYFVLTTFQKEMSTLQVYSAFDHLPPQQPTNCQAMMEELCKGNLPIRLQNNHLALATQSLSAYAQSYLFFAKSQGLCPNMTGSGSAYYIWCESLQRATEIASLLKSNGFCSKTLCSLPFGIEQIG